MQLRTEHIYREFLRLTRRLSNSQIMMLLAVVGRPVCLRACLPAHRQARRQAIRKRLGSNTMWKRY